LYASPEYLKNAPPLRTVTDLAHHVFCTVASSSQQGDVKKLYRADESVEM
jgi:hypothetical protein